MKSVANHLNLCFHTFFHKCALVSIDIFASNSSCSLNYMKMFSFEQGYSEAQLKECLEEYAALNVWQIHPNTFDIRFIDA